MESKSEDRISPFFAGRIIFIAGGSGFVGKVFLEKLLRWISTDVSSISYVTVGVEQNFVQINFFYVEKTCQKKESLSLIYCDIIYGWSWSNVRLIYVSYTNFPFQRSCPDIGKIYLLIRSKKGKDPHERLKTILNDVVIDSLICVLPLNTPSP